MKLPDVAGSDERAGFDERICFDERSQPGARILRQLVEALLFEGVLKPRRALTGNGWQVLYFAAGERTCACHARIGAFGRVRIQPGSLRLTPARCGAPAARPEAASPPDTLWQDILAALTETPVHQRLCAELQQTQSLCNWNRRNLGPPPPRRRLSYRALESALDEGHPYHPCFKARTGFSLDDHRRYGPECGKSFALVWVAVRRSQLSQSLPQPEPAFWQRELGDNHWFRLRAGFNRLGVDWDDYAALPVHPWQWQKLSRGPLQTNFRLDLESDQRADILYLGTFGDRFCATQSVRTLFNADKPRGAALKLPLAMVNTSAERSLAPHSVATAPALSAWLKKTVAGDAFFNGHGRMVILAEYAGMLYQPSNETEKLAGQLGALWRENVENHLEEGEDAVPFNALLVSESDGRPFIEEWINRYGLVQLLTQLIRCAVLPVWHLLAAHGIALEAHAQNMILLHRNGWPTGVALRDFHESVEYVDDFLADPAASPDFGAIDPAYRNAPDDLYFRMGSVESLRELVTDALFVFNLAELSCLLEQAWALREDDFWAEVRQQLNRYAREGHTTAERIARLGYDQRTVRSEALFTRKLRSDTRHECHHQISNALGRLRPEPQSNHPTHSNLSKPLTSGSREHALRE